VTARRRAGRGPTAAAPRPLERAQLVWQRALTLARRGASEDRDRFAVMLDLLRTAHHGPATMSHALALGEAHGRDTPGDPATGDAVRLLAGTIAWFGRPTDDGEVGRTAARRHSA
jgi:hypothetical protein